VSSDASNKGENDEHTGNDDRDRDPEEREGHQEIGEGDEARESKKDSEGTQGEEHPIRQQGREGSGIDEAQGRRNSRGNREGDRLAESQHSRVCQRTRDQEARAERRVHEERRGGAHVSGRELGLTNQQFGSRSKGRLCRMVAVWPTLLA